MDNQADGKIIVDTEINSEGFKAGSTELKRAIRSLGNTVNGLGPTFRKALSGSDSAMQEFTKQADALRFSIADIESKMDVLANTKTPTKEFAKLCAEAQKVDAKVKSLEDRLAKMEALGTSVTSKAYQNLCYDLDVAKGKAWDLHTAMQQLVATGNSHISGVDTQEYAQLSAQLNSAKNELSSMEAQEAKVERKAHGIGAAFRKVGTAIGTAAKAVGGTLINGLKKVLLATKKLISSNNLYGKSLSKLRSTLGRFSIGLLGVRAVYGILQKAVQSYMNANQGLANQLSSCWTSLGNLLGPLITKIINMVSTAIAYVTAFLKLLGMTGSAASNAVEGAGGAAEDAQRSIAGFDEINKLSDKSSSGSGSSSATIEDASLPDWTQLMIEQIKSGNWAAAANTLTHALNGMVASVDWANVGNNIAYWIDGALGFLATAITSFDWNNLGTSLGIAINNLVYGVDWGNLGVVLGAKLFSLVEGLGGLFATLDWSAVGKSIADSIMGLWNSIDWKQAASTLSSGIVGILSSLSNAIKNVDWQKLGNDIATFIANIDYGGIFTTLSEGLGSALGGLATFVWGLIQDAWASVVAWWYDVAYEDGSFTIEGLLQGIWDGICNIGQWIVENIFTPFINGFKAAFGIHSPSTVMAEQGGFIIEGLLQGITAAWSAITTFFGNALASVKATLSNAWDSIKSAASSAWSAVSSTVSNAWANISTAVSDKVSSIKSAVANGWSNVKSTISNTVSTISSTVSSKWSSISSTINSKVSSIKSTVSTGFNNVKSSITSKMSSAMSTIKNLGWSGVGSAICSGIGNGISSGWNWLKDKVSSVASSLLSAAKSALGIHSPSRLFRDVVGLNIGYGIGEGIAESEGSVIHTVAGVADAIAEEFNSGSYSIGNIGVDSNGNVVRGLDNFSSAITDSFTKLMDRLQNIAQSVTFTAPAVMSTAIPYSAATSAERISGGGSSDNFTEFSSDVDERLADVTYQLKQILAGIRALNLNIDLDALADAITQQQRSKLRNFGGV